jgi:hypothetical protein
VPPQLALKAGVLKVVSFPVPELVQICQARLPVPPWLLPECWVPPVGMAALQSTVPDVVVVPVDVDPPV